MVGFLQLPLLEIQRKGQGMRKFIRSGLIAVLVINLMACGVRDTTTGASSGSNNSTVDGGAGTGQLITSGNDGGGNSSDTNSTGGPLDTSGIAGFWDFSLTAELRYVLISEDGDWTLYTDSQFSNCFDLDLYEVVHGQGDNYVLYESITSRPFNGSIVGGNLTIVYSESAGEASSIYPPVDGLTPIDVIECI